jgi:hypothetical protein
MSSDEFIEYLKVLDQKKYKNISWSYFLNQIFDIVQTTLVHSSENIENR